MQELKIFENEQFGKVRTLQIEKEPYFVAIDVCNILGLTNPTVAISRLDEDEVTKFNLGSLSGETNIVNEYGLYNLILASRKPQAKAFKRWITQWKGTQTLITPLGREHFRVLVAGLKSE